MEGEAAQDTLRDTIAEQVGKLEDTSAPAAPAPTATPAEPAAATPQGAPEPQSERPRDEHGRFVAQQEKPAEQKQEAKPALAPKAAPQAPQATTRAPLARPSSWKKDYWGHWEKLTKGEPLTADEAYALAQYNLQREGDMAKGVSAYKAEFDRAKPLVDAMQQFAPEIQRMGVKPEQFIANLGNAHKTLALGTPEQKLSMFLKIAQDYQVPVQQLFARGQDGQVYYNPQVQPYQPPAQPQQDVEAIVEKQLVLKEAARELQAFEAEAAKGTEGKFQHYEAVKPEMAQLLETGFSKTLESAYETALRLPQHFHLFEQAQQAKREADAKAAAEKARAEAERARRNTVSPRSSTPAVKSGDGKPRSVRESYEAAFEQVVPGDRV